MYKSSLGVSVPRLHRTGPRETRTAPATSRERERLWSSLLCFLPVIYSVHKRKHNKLSATSSEPLLLPPGARANSRVISLDFPRARHMVSLSGLETQRCSSCSSAQPLINRVNRDQVWLVGQLSGSCFSLPPEKPWLPTPRHTRACAHFRPSARPWTCIFQTRVAQT